MTSYQGGKKRPARKIHAVLREIEADLTGGKTLSYFEPFVGMASVLYRFTDEDRSLYACDANEDLICMWRAVQDGWKPPRSCSEKR